MWSNGRRQGKKADLQTSLHWNICRQKHLQTLTHCVWNITLLYSNTFYHFCSVAQYAIFLSNEFDISVMGSISVTLNLLFEDLFDWTEKCYILFQTLKKLYAVKIMEAHVRHKKKKVSDIFSQNVDLFYPTQLWDKVAILTFFLRIFPKDCNGFTSFKINVLKQRFSILFLASPALHTLKTFLKRLCIWQILHVIHFICDLSKPRESITGSRKSPISIPPPTGSGYSRR